MGIGVTGDFWVARTKKQIVNAKGVTTKYEVYYCSSSKVLFDKYFFLIKKNPGFCLFVTKYNNLQIKKKSAFQRKLSFSKKYYQIIFIHWIDLLLRVKSKFKLIWRRNMKVFLKKLSILFHFWVLYYINYRELGQGITWLRRKHPLLSKIVLLMAARWQDQSSIIKRSTKSKLFSFWPPQQEARTCGCIFWHWGLSPQQISYRTTDGTMLRRKTSYNNFHSI